MTRRRGSSLCLVVVVAVAMVVVGGGGGVEGQTFKQGLPQAHIDASSVGIAGLSAGAFQTVQMGVAYSTVFSGYVYVFT